MQTALLGSGILLIASNEIMLHAAMYAVCMLATLQNYLLTFGTEHLVRHNEQIDVIVAGELVRPQLNQLMAL